MSAAELLEHETPVSDDGVLMPESDEHRRLRDLIAVAATRALGPDHRVFSGLNYYPPDASNPVGADAMVVPAAAVPKGRVRSFRQPDLVSPGPGVAVEIPSDSDSLLDFRRKLKRFQRLGIVTYVAISNEDDQQLLRLAPDDLEPQAWTGRPVPELGGVSFVVEGDALKVRTHDGAVVSSNAELVDHFERLAVTARDEADRALAEADRALAEADRALAEADRVRAEADRVRAEADRALADADTLRAQLRTLGAEPTA